MNFVEEQVRESAEVKQKILSNKELLKNIEDICEIVLKAYKEGKKLIICGNGGSAADAQHFAAELVGRFKMEREALPAIAITTDSSILTSLGNDYSYDYVFERQVEAFCSKGDIVVGISTSGNSKNVTGAFRKAHEKGGIAVALLGKTGGENLKFADYSFVVPSMNTPRIQECHIMVIHIICEVVEKKLFEEMENE